MPVSVFVNCGETVLFSVKSDAVRTFATVITDRDTKSGIKNQMVYADNYSW